MYDREIIISLACQKKNTKPLECEDSGICSISASINGHFTPLYPKKKLNSYLADIDERAEDLLFDW